MKSDGTWPSVEECKENSDLEFEFET